MKRKKISWLALPLVVVLGLMLWRYAYPMVIASLAAPPASWERAARAKTWGELHAMLGMPDEDACEKQYANWLIKHWWGHQQLKVLVEKCTMEAKVVEVYYVLHAPGFYDPIAVRPLR